MNNYIILVCTSILFLISQYTFSQRQISGRLINEEGEGLPGVNIVLKGTTIGTMTDFDGFYSLTVPDKVGTLVFSFVGFKTSELVLDETSELNLLVTEEFGIHKLYWCCTTHNPKPHCNSKKEKLKKTHSKNERFVASIE